MKWDTTISIIQTYLPWKCIYSQCVRCAQRQTSSYYSNIASKVSGSINYMGMLGAKTRTHSETATWENISYKHVMIVASAPHVYQLIFLTSEYAVLALFHRQTPSDSITRPQVLRSNSFRWGTPCLARTSRNLGLYLAQPRIIRSVCASA